jgi:hypothetical protein
MSSLDVYLTMTFILGGFVILATVLQYNNTDYDAKLKALINTVTGGLGFLLVVYTSLMGGAVGPNRSMYRNLILLLSAGSLVLVTLQGSNITVGEGTSGEGASDGGWAQVAQAVAVPLAQGALFALPMVFFGYPY